MQTWVGVDCPYCGQRYDSVLDLSAGDQVYTEDCAICCRPIVLGVRVDAAGELAQLTCRREQD